jgi:hypothetical protein
VKSRYPIKEYKGGRYWQTYRKELIYFFETFDHSPDKKQHTPGFGHLNFEENSRYCINIHCIISGKFGIDVT